MCGIIAINTSNNFRYNIKKSLKEIKHKGPNDEGIFYSSKNDCQLGHVRLSIIDISNNGHQPMFSKNNRYVISYNGEIYNYI